ncbi:MAG TPA: DegQ family serine endoprotease [Pseudomonadales bacterium]|nr:DegQ family serine endoprotease [Pseudomonadales bacterium]
MRQSMSAAVVSLCLLVMSFAVQARELPQFTDIVKKNSPAVVKITTMAVAQQQGQNPYNQFNDPRIPEIFRELFQQRGQPNQAPQQRQQSMGSGFIISKDGYVLTNNHVIDGGDEITVRLPDRSEYKATLIGTDVRSDLALLKIEGDNDFPTVTFGKPRDLEVGEWVLAIGSPFGLDYSVSAGIVSAKGRSLPSEEAGNYVPFIQTDVAINPGNSGGPLFNMNGEVVGINSQIYTRSGGSIGLSFSIPIEVALNVVEQLKDKGQVVRGWLGVVIQDVDSDLAEAYGLKRPRGALIAQMEKDGPAEKSGIEIGDIILEFNGTDIVDSADLPHEVGLTKAGSEVPVLVARNGEQVRLKVKVGSLEGDGANTIASTGEDPGGRLGALIEELTDEQRASMRLLGGVVITRVLPDSPASRAGLRAGDIVTLINNRPISSAENYRQAIADLPSGKAVPMRIIRNGRAGFVALRIDD